MEKLLEYFLVIIKKFLVSTLAKMELILFLEVINIMIIVLLKYGKFNDIQLKLKLVDLLIICHYCIQKYGFFIFQYFY